MQPGQNMPDRLSEALGIKYCCGVEIIDIAYPGDGMTCIRDSCRQPSTCVMHAMNKEGKHIMFFRSCEKCIHYFMNEYKEDHVAYYE